MLTSPAFLFFSALLLSASLAQRNNVPCGFSCTRNARFMVSLDGQNAMADCSNPGRNNALTDRCNSCCQAFALTAGLSAERAAAFPSSDGRTCVCCTNNDRCGRPGPIPAAAMDSDD